MDTVAVVFVVIAVVAAAVVIGVTIVDVVS